MIFVTNSLVPRPNLHAGKRVWCTSSDFLGFPVMQNNHVILIIVMATHCLVCWSRISPATTQCGLICAAGALSHEKSHAVNLIGAPEIRTATSSSPRNRSKYTRPSSPCRGGVWDRDYVTNGVPYASADSTSTVHAYLQRESRLQQRRDLQSACYSASADSTSTVHAYLQRESRLQQRRDRLNAESTEERQVRLQQRRD